MGNSKYLTRPDRIAILVCCIILWSCHTTQNKEPVQDIVYEGMTKYELRQVLGEPLQMDSGRIIFDVLKNKKIRLDRWTYEQRTVVIMDDTVRSANENIN